MLVMSERAIRGGRKATDEGRLMKEGGGSEGRRRGYEEWRGKSKEDIRDALRAKVVASKGGVADAPF